MEGYLQVPPERNLIGSRGAWKMRYVVFGCDTPRAFPVRPSAADRHSYPHNAAGIASASNAQEIRSSFFLTIYKSKSVSEPAAKYSIQDIASCYVGDLGIKQRNIMPTLIIHLRPDHQQVTSPRSFRRRSHENPNAAKSAPTALFFQAVH